MSKPQDGLVSRYLNRPISRRLTRLLLKFPITPNTWTTAILIFPMAASILLTRGDYLSIAIGAAFFQLYSILDGCDGEIARAKNLQSKFGARLDNLCDFAASILFIIGLGIGLHRLLEAIICAAFLIGNEWLLGTARLETEVRAGLDESFYERHHGMIAHSGLLKFGETFVWWIFQLTKRDVAVLAFLALALIGRPDWILNLWLLVAVGSLLLNIASTFRRSEIATDLPRP